MNEDNKNKKHEKGKTGKCGRCVRLVSRLKSNRRKLMWSFVAAVALFVVSYFLHNLPWSWGGPNLGQRIERLKHYAVGETVPSELFLINVAYDRQLVEINDATGLPLGNIDITDRSKLFKLLEQLKKADYKYIILDVLFSDKCHTEMDSTLFSLIASMDNIVVAKSETITLADDILEDKARYSDYSKNILESDFVKYEYIRNGEPTLPYQMYLDLGGDMISQCGGLYFFKGRLANKSVILRHPIRLSGELKDEKEVDYMGEIQYFDMGSDIFDTGLDIATEAKGKIVVIGDFTENDMHDTYLGKMAGPVINLNAYYGLVNDNLSMPYREIIFIILVYTIMWFCIFKRISLISIVPFFRNKCSILARLFISFASNIFLLMVISGLMYIIFGLDMRILIASTVFSFADTFIKYKNKKQE